MSVIGLLALFVIGFFAWISWKLNGSKSFEQYEAERRARMTPKEREVYDRILK